MRSLGLVGEPILRVGRSVAGGVRRASEERAASLSLIPWSLEGDLRTMLLGDAVDEIAASALSPTALAWFDTEPATRLLVSVESANLQPGLRDDVAMALSLAASIAKRRRRIFSMGPIDDTALRSAGIEVPPSVEATPGPDDRQAWLDERWRSGDLIIMASCGNPRGSDPPAGGKRTSRDRRLDSCNLEPRHECSTRLELMSPGELAASLRSPILHAHQSSTTTCRRAVPWPTTSSSS